MKHLTFDNVMMAIGMIGGVMVLIGLIALLVQFLILIFTTGTWEMGLILLGALLFVVGVGSAAFAKES